MDPNYSFNSKPNPSFTRPPRLAKHRKPFSANRPKGTIFTQNVETDKVFDDLMKLKIQPTSTSSSSGLRGVDESVVSELPDEMRQLYIETEVLGKNAGDLPNKMKKLNVKDDSERVVLDNVLQDKLKGLKIKDLSSLNETTNDSKFVFGNKGEGVGEVSSMYNADKKFEFGFTSKVEFKTPEPKGGFVFGFNDGYKKKKGKLNKPVQAPFVFGFQESSDNYAESSEQYSPMEVSPYEETLVGDNVVSREASVASEESSYIDDNFSSTDEHPNPSNDIADEQRDDLSNDMTDEQLVSVTERLHINEPAVKVSEVRYESTEEGGFSGAETESFISANEELDYSCDSFVTARDDELSSASSIERQNSDARTKFKYDFTSLPDTGQSSFIFGASSTNRSEFSSSLSSQKKKNRTRVGQDLFGSTSNVKNSHISALLSPEQGKKSNLSNPLRHRTDQSKQVELEAKLDSNTTASIAAQESCEKWRLRGNQAYAKGEFLKAEDCYTQGINCISENEVSRTCRRALLLCYSNLAATHMSLGRVREALQDCMKAAVLDPSFLKVQVRAGSCYLTLGDVESASLHFMKCLQSGSDASADRKLLVEASDGLEKTRKVVECIKQAEELLGQRTSHDTDSANRLISEALSISSLSEKLLQMKVDALLMLRKYEELIQFCENLLSMESNFLKSGVDHSLKFNGSDLKSAPSFRVWCCTLILKSYFLLGRLEQAVEFVKRQDESVSLMERSESKNLECTIQLVGTIHELLRHKAAGNEAFQSGNHSEAIEHYTACISCSIESRPFSAICFCNRAAAYRAMGQIIDALSDCTLAIALDANYFKAIARRASLYEMIRDYGQAITDLQKLVALLKKEVDKKNNPSVPSDTKRSCVNELRETQVKLSELEEVARKETPLNMYLILGVDPSAASSEIRKAYRRAALKYHPDKAGQSVARNEIGDDGIWKEIAEEVHKDADRLFKMIGEAYAVLSDPTKRSRYDMEEEVRKLANRGHGISSSKMYSDSNSYSFEKGGSRRQWQPQDRRRNYENINRYF